MIKGGKKRIVEDLEKAMLLTTFVFDSIEGFKIFYTNRYKEDDRYVWRGDTELEGKHRLYGAIYYTLEEAEYYRLREGYYDLDSLRRPEWRKKMNKTEKVGWSLTSLGCVILVGGLLLSLLCITFLGLL